MISPIIPSTHLTRSALLAVEQVLPPPFLNHALRTYLLSSILHTGAGSPANQEVLFQAAVFHHWGLFHTRQPHDCFEIESADFGRRFVVEFGGSPAQAECVWETIALHMTPGIAVHRTLETASFARAIQIEVHGTDYSAFSQEDWSSLFTHYPRAGFKRALLAALANAAEIRSETVAGTYLAEVGERLVPGFITSNFCDRVSEAPFPD
jgi:hypothetical protein